MSQAGKVITSGGGGGSPVLTITGNIGGAISPTGGNINVLFDATQPGAGTTSKTATSTLTVDNYIKQTVATTDGTTVVPLYTLAIPNNTSITVNALVSAKSSDFARATSGAVRVGAINNGGTVSLIGATASSLAVFPNGNTAQLSTAISGTNLEITVKGEAGVNYTWMALIYYVTN